MNKENNKSFPEGTFTSADIKQLKEYVEALDALDKEPINTVTWEEWDEFYKELNATGKIPNKYKGRIKENIVEVKDAVRDELDEDGNPIIDEWGNPVYTHVVYDKPIKQTFYIDVVQEEHNAKLSAIQAKYHDIMVKAILKTPAETANEAGFLPVMELIRELLKNPEVVKQLEKEAGIGKLAPLGSVPNGDSLNWLYRVISQSKNGRTVTANNANRHEVITTQEKGGKVRFTRENTQNKSKVVVEIDQADKLLNKSNISFLKMLYFTLQKMTDQHNPLEVSFSLQELVDLGVYSTTTNANKAVKEFFAQQKLTTLSGTVKKGAKTIQEEGGVLFYHYRLKNGYVTLSVNENFNMDFIANYFTVFPRFAYALNKNAFSLVRYIFFLARQNAKAIKEKGSFNISLEAVRENLGIIPVEEVTHRKYKQYIIDPIEKAIEEIEEALQNLPEAKEYGFTITPHVPDDTSNINKWLEGYLEIGLSGDFAKDFIRIAEKAEKDREQWEKAKQSELAKIEARNKAKEEREAKAHQKKNT